ncbi:ras [Anaeramoeba flamelloides]|uniref:Ras n=1 Tax=Anaeramoeba flamelloides TaxID=1746091 RepID=A0AAV7Y7N3_9EUKA|nr:ras di-ras and rheb family members of small gtpase superfamily [Anaeramoeba flamelloides]KAJ6236737.1 ras [Anaeramoeba flamelloides]
MNENDKIMILGDSKVGKTTLKQSFQNMFLCDIDEEWEKTYKMLLEFEDQEYFLGIRDFLRQEPTDVLMDHYCSKFCNFILMYSVTSKESFTKAEEIMGKFKTQGEQKHYVLFANKINCPETSENRVVSAEEGQNLAKEYDCPYYECSLESKEKLESIFVNILHYFIILKERINYSDLIQDFENLFERQEFCDHIFQLQNDEQIGVHKLIIQSKLNISLQNIQKVLLTISPEQSKLFLKWIYCGYTKNSNYPQINEICHKLNLDFKNFSGVTKLIDDLKCLYENEQNKDFTLKIGQTHIKVHKLILAARSDLFRGLFLACKKSCNQVNDYSNTSSLIIQNLIYFFYTNEVPLQLIKKDSFHFLQLIDYYQLNTQTSLNNKLFAIKNNKACTIM